MLVIPRKRTANDEPNSGENRGLFDPSGEIEEAIEWVKRAPNVFPLNGEAVVEIRKLMDAEDFGEGFTPNEEIAKVKFK